MTARGHFGGLQRPKGNGRPDLAQYALAPAAILIVYASAIR
jgi:hypothetical protein